LNIPATHVGGTDAAKSSAATSLEIDAAQVAEELLINEFVVDRTTAIKLFEQGKFDEALAAILPWKDLLKGNSPSILPFQADLYLSLGAAYEKLGNTNEAEIFTGMALAISQRLEREGRHSPHYRAVLLMNLGTILKDAENFPNAIATFDKARTLLRAMRPLPYSLLAQVELQRGQSYLGNSSDSGGDVSAASRAFSASLSLIDAGCLARSMVSEQLPEVGRTPVPRGYEGIACFHLGLFALTRGNFLKAFNFLSRAVQSGERDFSPSSDSYLQQRQALGVASLYICDYETALTQGARLIASTQRTEVEDSPSEAQAHALFWGLTLRGVVHGAQGKTSDAIKNFLDCSELEVTNQEISSNEFLKLAGAAAARAKQCGKLRAARGLLEVIAEITGEE
jgi:tetratricopeptide (TPR) repeat protein